MAVRRNSQQPPGEPCPVKMFIMLKVVHRENAGRECGDDTGYTGFSSAGASRMEAAMHAAAACDGCENPLVDSAINHALYLNRIQADSEG
ncbi:hypothetical protein SKAU_G00004250 [Synaphobranchus kaupii]|uniref:Uncharacterized protein n=1 Tax=Synaphobranchus kaupii TaxID=118154 RepID=A0A9Q1JCQ0_SYNKA|nr:hypothetical protein SKAU_G00004250 [Synaphobranchus kaupii]